MSKVTLTVAKTTDALKRQGVLLSLSIHDIGDINDTLIKWSHVMDEERHFAYASVGSHGSRDMGQNRI